MSKEFLQNAAVGLRGCPIVGFYDKDKQDFLGHEKELIVDNGEFKYIDITRPYGFVDLNAKIWFQKFKDDNSIIREYLCTEGYIWSEAYPEAKRLLMGDNNQSIHLHEPSVNGFWTQNLNQGNKFFIFNEGLIENLCILGEEVEPCFEGANFKPASDFSLENEIERLKKMSQSMINDILKYSEGGQKGMEYNLEDIKEYKQLQTDYAALEEKFKNASSVVEKYEQLVKDYAALEEKFKDAEKVAEDYSILQEKYNTDLADYTAVVKKSEALAADNEKISTEFSDLKTQYELLNTEVEGLKDYKLAKETKEKEDLIASFSMLDEEDKKPIIEKINDYSLDEIESKLAVIGFRKKINFDTTITQKDNDPQPQLQYNFNNEGFNDVPEWIKAVQVTASQRI